ncbi:MAG: ATP-binding protein [Euryarchaeota archaeon]|nr:ATP-binding protein [Euryarchaeota archaeon]
MAKENSPFTPGIPVPIDYFIGRTREVERINRAIVQTSAGRNENLFLTGERGIGKSSLAALTRYIAEEKYQFVGAHCYVGAARNVSDVCRIVLTKMLQAMPDKGLFDKARTVVGKYIKGIQLGVFGVGMNIEFTDDQKLLEDLPLNFLSILRGIFETIKEDKTGLLLILDDLNGMSNVPEFSYFLKSFVDEIASSQKPLPILLILVGIPDRMGDLAKNQPSISRIFNVIELNSMNNNESEEFFKKAFESADISIEQDALPILTRYSGGLPVLLHEVGDAVYWEDFDNCIGRDDAIKGIFHAAENVGRKYLDRQVYQTLRSETYHSILRRMGKLPLEAKFQRKELVREMSDSERRNFDNFRRRMEELGVLAKEEVRGEYRFSNELFRLYVMIESLIAEESG